MRVRLFGFSRIVVGKSEIKLELTGLTSISDIRRTLLCHYQTLIRDNIHLSLLLTGMWLLLSLRLSHTWMMLPLLLPVS